MKHQIVLNDKEVRERLGSLFGVAADNVIIKYNRLTDGATETTAIIDLGPFRFSSEMVEKIEEEQE